MKLFAHVLAVFCAFVLGATASAQSVPPGYPADYQAIVAAAEQEGSVVVYSATDSASADALLKDFRALYPKVQIRYHDLNSTEIYNRYLSETAANAHTALINDLMRAPRCEFVGHSSGWSTFHPLRISAQLRPGRVIDDDDLAVR